MIANAIHQNSNRVNKPFIKVNCAALSDSLLESELFGHEKDAFTGARARRLGRFEQAHGGTLFLDEIGDMSPITQTKILRVLQEGEFERVGGEKTIKVDVRIIAATNKNLEEEVKNNNFRLDLFLRYSWPGNIRELENVIQRAVILCKEDTLIQDVLPAHFKDITTDITSSVSVDSLVGLSIKEVEKELILRTLKQTINK